MESQIGKLNLGRLNFLRKFYGNLPTILCAAGQSTPAPLALSVRPFRILSKWSQLDGCYRQIEASPLENLWRAGFALACSTDRVTADLVQGIKPSTAGELVRWSWCGDGTAG